VAILCLSPLAIAGTEDRSFEKQRLDVAEKIEKILIADNICKSKTDCFSKKLVFATPKESGIGIQLYAPIGKASLLKILHECSNYFVASNIKMNIEVEMFDVTKDEELNLPIWQFTKPAATVRFSGRR